MPHSSILLPVVDLYPMHCVSCAEELSLARASMAHMFWEDVRYARVYVNSAYYSLLLVFGLNEGMGDNWV